MFCTQSLASFHLSMFAPQGCCYGCGARLQIEVPMGPGYVKADKYESKKRHRQLDKVSERSGLN